MPTPPLSDDKLKQAVQALAAAGGNMVRAAREAGLSRTTLQSRIREAERRGLANHDDARLIAACEREELRSLATPHQFKIAAAVNAHWKIDLAAEALGMTPTEVRSAIGAMIERAALQGVSPAHGWTRATPGTHTAKGVSTYYPAVTETTPDGTVHVLEPAAWVKANMRQEAYNEAVKGAIAAFLEDVPQVPIAPAPLDFQSDIIPWIQIGDAHIGMLAHAAEVGENFDLKIAERELCGSIAQLVDEMPPCERVVINDLGDATHYDNLTATTAASGHALDADGRHPKMLRVYVRIMRFIVDRVLTKAKHVDVIINQGNHSRINDFWMRELLTVAYSGSDRVTVLDNDSVFIGYRMGKTLVMTHHSDKCKGQALVNVMTSDFKKDYGETDFHYIDVGHVHHHYVSKEHPSVVIESWNHLAANDKYAHEGGWRSRKSISVVLRSRTYGDVGRRHLPIEEVRARLLRLGEITTLPAKREAHAV
jgi:transposase-like protein